MGERGLYVRRRYAYSLPRSMSSAIRFLYPFISRNSQSAVSAYSTLYSGVYHFFRHSADYFSAIWRSIVRFRTISTESSISKRGFTTKSSFCRTNTVLSESTRPQAGYLPFFRLQVRNPDGNSENIFCGIYFPPKLYRAEYISRNHKPEPRTPAE